MKITKSKKILIATGKKSSVKGGGFMAVVVSNKSHEENHGIDLGFSRATKDHSDFKVTEIEVTLEFSLEKSATNDGYLSQGGEFIACALSAHDWKHGNKGYYPIVETAIFEWIQAQDTFYQEFELTLDDFQEKTLNLTQHKASAEQTAAGVVNLPAPQHMSQKEADKYLSDLLTFHEIPSKNEMKKRAQELAEIANFSGFKKVLIGGAPFFMSVLEQTLKENEITPVYAFSVRESIEKEVDGKIIKTNVFKHVGFVEV